MLRTIPTRLALVAALILSVPAATAAQGPTPEGTDWRLVQYAGDSGLVSVPWYVEATFTLEGDAVFGSAGCNGFGGSAELDGLSVSFSELTMTTMGCPEPVESVETGYLAALSDVASWGISPAGEHRFLYLQDAGGASVLVFRSTPPPTDTGSDGLAAELDALEARIERHEERIDNIRIGALRDRIRALEAAVAQTAGPDLSAFSEAERVLLSAVRADIAETCEPRRTQNPKGTVAALQCKPDAPEVRDMAYYLMESDDAWQVYRQRMRDNKVRNGTENRACAFGRPSQMAWVGGGIVNAGCYRDDNGRANLRFVNTLADCRQLTAGSTQVTSPSIYIAVLGPDRDIASLWGWAASSTDWEAGEDLFDPIKQAGQPWSDQCPRG